MKAKKLLIVDDALFMRQTIRQIALSAGWEIAGEAGDGREAIEAYEREQPGLVTLDIVMPKMDGVATLKELMQRDPAARIVMVSAVNQKAKLAECIQCGAIDFIVKPFDKSELKSFFEKALASQTQ
ncbi:MAG: response regulator [Planctomycetota bacterium]